MEEGPTYCVYYDLKSEKILDFFPMHIDGGLKSTVISIWQQDIPRKILQALSEGPLSMQDLRKKIGHSTSTLHENVLKLEDAGLISTKLIYEGNKIRILSPKFLFVTKSPKFKTAVQRFFQGIWVNSSASEKVVGFLKAHPDQYYTVEEIAAKNNLTVDEVDLALSNWESQVTRALSDFLKRKPFEKKTMYRGYAK